MIWFLPWAVGAMSWPVTYALTGNPTICTGVSLVLYGAMCVVGGFLRW